MVVVESMDDVGMLVVEMVVVAVALGPRVLSSSNTPVVDGQQSELDWA